MIDFKVRSATEQVADYLRGEIHRRRWTGHLPGGTRLAQELGVGKSTIEAALALLDAEGLLVPQGTGRPRRIESAKSRKRNQLPVKLILYERDDVVNSDIMELRRQLELAGFELLFAPKTLVELKHAPQTVARMVRADSAKIWIVVAGSQPVLESVLATGVSVFAFFGNFYKLPIAGTGPETLPVLREALQQLIDRGHRRIVMLTREEWRKPRLSSIAQALLDELKARGLPAGPYNLPDWEETAGGLTRCLDSLFAVTPPSVLFVSDPILCFGIRSYLARQRGVAPRRVILVSIGYHPSFAWCDPPVPHVSWDPQVIVRRVVRWVNHVSQGKEDRRQHFVPARFVAGDLPRPGA